MTQTIAHAYTPRGAALELFKCRDPEVLLSGPAGTGKAQPVDAVVWTPTGPARMGEISVGDEVLTPTGRAKVRAIHPQGRQPVYRVTFTGGDTVECTADHLWALSYTGGGGRARSARREVRTVAKLNDIQADYLVSCGTRGRRPKYWIPQSGPADFDPRPVPIPAYTLGVLLGDGHVHRRRGVSFTSADPEIAERVATEMAGRYRVGSTPKAGTTARTYRISADGWRPTRTSTAKRGYVSRTGSGKWMAITRVADGSRYLGSFGSKEGAEAALVDAEIASGREGDGLGHLLDELGLEGAHAWQKFVPARYRHNTAAIRLEVLRGLMDTDGTVDAKTGTPSFTSTSQRLAEDVKELVESLGGVCRITEKPTTHRLAYTCWIRVPSPAVLFHLRRKAERCRARTKYPVKRMLLSIEPAGEKDCQCIELDNDEGLYLTDHFVVTHNSRSCLEKLHMLALVNPGMRGLIVRKTLASLGSTALVTWREHVVKEALDAGMVTFYGGSPQESPQYRYANGSTVTIGGLDKAQKIMSSEYDCAYVQEAIELTEDDWEAITTRLRNGKISFQQIISDTNPAQPTHWLKARADRGVTRMLDSRHEDNPVLFDDGGKLTEFGRNYISKLDALTGVRYLRLRRGVWAAADGIVYEDFDPTVHVVDRFKIPTEWTRYWTVDFGYVHPFVCQMWAEDPDGRLYLYREIYRSKRTVDQLAIDILCAGEKTRRKDNPAPTHKDYKYNGETKFAWQGRIWHEPKPRAVICDHDAEGRAVLERELGLTTVAAKKTVSDGIQAVQQRLRFHGDGKPRLFVMRDAVVDRDEELAEAKKPTCTAEEFLGYVWDTGQGKKPKEAPLKVDDHGMDALRYVCAHLDLRSRARIRWL